MPASPVSVNRFALIQTSFIRNFWVSNQFPLFPIPFSILTNRTKMFGLFCDSNKNFILPVFAKLRLSFDHLLNAPSNKVVLEFNLRIPKSKLSEIIAKKDYWLSRDSSNSY
ncbi:hypothetical protein BpHYR1_013271 [Brachionus plicatilis]|uniref:Uncharacterized protein n=1 Tax=Brachionus plicatilis TaxID=10195 RepID=A0A3M7SQE6_BRAPC|nr:hypothetical protein BpHYR1_013271 [Brachionus plicatilis]